MKGEMRYWAIETSLGCLLADEVAVPRAVARIVGRPTVGASCFSLSGRPSTRSGKGSSRKKEPFDEELKHTRGPSEEPYLGFLSFALGELVEVVGRVYSDARYMVTDPDASVQEV
ncbi:MAG: hypothetical protein M3309_06115 [Actinomycetota bacterium]|nr:hypothetical protein [Actinomycetota bacterium]